MPNHATSHYRTELSFDLISGNQKPLATICVARRPSQSSIKKPLTVTSVLKAGALRILVFNRLVHIHSASYAKVGNIILSFGHKSLVSLGSKLKTHNGLEGFADALISCLWSLSV